MRSRKCPKGWQAISDKNRPRPAHHSTFTAAERPKNFTGTFTDPVFEFSPYKHFEFVLEYLYALEKTPHALALTRSRPILQAARNRHMRVETCSVETAARSSPPRPLLPAEIRPSVSRCSRTLCRAVSRTLSLAPKPARAAAARPYPTPHQHQSHSSPTPAGATVGHAT